MCLLVGFLHSAGSHKACKGQVKTLFSHLLLTAAQLLLTTTTEPLQVTFNSKILDLILDESPFNSVNPLNEQITDII